MNSINVYLDATGFRDFQTGVGRYSYQLITELLKIEKHWHFVVLIQRNLSHTHPIYELVTRYQNLTIRKIYTTAIGPKRDLGFLLAPVKGYHLYHCLNSNLPLNIRSASVVTVHDVIYRHYPQFLGAFYPLKIKYYNMLMRHVAKQAEQIIAVSHATAKDFVFHYAKNAQEKQNIANKITVIYEGAFDVGHRRVQYDSEREKTYFLFVGELRPHKNIHRLMEGFAHFRSVTPDAERVMLYIAGSPHASYSLSDPLPENVKYCGRVGDQELMELYRGAIALCFVSLYEGFGLPILEAMRNNVPVITSSISSMPEIAGDAALLVDPKNSVEIGEAMARVFASPKLRVEMARNGAQRALQFSWEQAAIQTRMVYEKLLSRQGRG